MIGLLTRLALDEEAQDLIEYALLSALLAVACITAVLGLSQMREFFARAGQALNDAL
jgi:Flp pilus assembly pilin Flp